MIRYNVDNFLPLGLCPGPSQPKDLDSFLVPFIDELNILRQGVPAYDAQTESSFLLKAHLVLLSGDTPGISKLLHLRGHNAQYPCRACKLEVSPYKVAFKTKGSERTRYTITRFILLWISLSFYSNGHSNDHSNGSRNTATLFPISPSYLSEHQTIMFSTAPQV
jgi:Transposase family tnp2